MSEAATVSEQQESQQPVASPIKKTKKQKPVKAAAAAAAAALAEVEHAAAEEGIIDETLRGLSAMTCRDWTIKFTLISFLTATACVFWKLIVILAWSEIPIVVVLSGSMEPGYQRGDLLILSTPSRPIEAGDIMVFKIKGRDIPIVHRANKMHIDAFSQNKSILTKGDNNYGNDLGLYNPGQFYISEDDVMGRSVLYVPFVGQFTILMAETKGLREVVIVVLLLIVFLNNEEQ